MAPAKRPEWRGSAGRRCAWCWRFGAGRARPGRTARRFPAGDSQQSETAEKVRREQPGRKRKVQETGEPGPLGQASASDAILMNGTVGQGDQNAGFGGGGFRPAACFCKGRAMLAKAASEVPAAALEAELRSANPGGASTPGLPAGGPGGQGGPAIAFRGPGGGRGGPGRARRTAARRNGALRDATRAAAKDQPHSRELL